MVGSNQIVRLILCACKVSTVRGERKKLKPLLPQDSADRIEPNMVYKQPAQGSYASHPTRCNCYMGKHFKSKVEQRIRRLRRLVASAGMQATIAPYTGLIYQL